MRPTAISIDDLQARGWRFYRFIAETIPPSSFNVMVDATKKRRMILRLLIDPAYLRTMDWPDSFEGTPVTVEERQPAVAYAQ